MASPQDIVLAFNDCITRQDLDGLAALMAENHRFVDSAGGEVVGKAASVKAWHGFFTSFPDYKNIFDSMASSPDGTVAAAGRSECSDHRLHGPALWTAIVVDGLLTEWRVFDDTQENRSRLGV